MKLVLHHRVKIVANTGLSVVVDAALRKNVGDLLIDSPFTRTNGANPLKQLFEVVGIEQFFTLLEALVVQRKAFYYEIPKHLCRPHTKMRSAFRIDPIPDRNDGVEVVMFHFPRNRPVALILNY